MSIKDACKLSQSSKIHVIQTSHKWYFPVPLGTFMKNQPRYSPPCKKKKETTWRCGAINSLQFVNQTHKSTGNNIICKNRHLADNPKVCWRAEFGRMHIGGIAVLFGTPRGSAVQWMHFGKLGFRLCWESCCLGPPFPTSQRRDFGDRVSGFQSFLWHVLAEQLLSSLIYKREQRVPSS